MQLQSRRLPTSACRQCRLTPHMASLLGRQMRGQIGASKHTTSGILAGRQQRRHLPDGAAVGTRLLVPSRRPRVSDRTSTCAASAIRAR